MNITSHTLKLYRICERNEPLPLPPIVSERIQAMLADPDEFTTPDSAHCWLYRRMTYSRSTFVTDTSLKRAESHSILVPDTQFWQIVHEAEFHFLISEHPAQSDLWFLTPAMLVGPALREAEQAQGHPEVLIVEQFVFTS
jgi:hypothetical protein